MHTSINSSKRMFNTIYEEVSFTGYFYFVKQIGKGGDITSCINIEALLFTNDIMRWDYKHPLGDNV
jgi:hypothetical protein